MQIQPAFQLTAPLSDTDPSLRSASFGVDDEMDITVGCGLILTFTAGMLAGAFVAVAFMGIFR